jgi:hypothetical protein
LVAYVPLRNHFTREAFGEQARAVGVLDAQAYWEFRDRYSPGTIDPNFSYIRVGQILELSSVPSKAEPLLRFDSKLISATDRVVERDELEAILAESEQAYLSAEPIALLTNSSIYRLEDQSWYLIGYWPINDWYLSNGLFNFTQEERELLADKLWVTEAIIRP